MLLLLSTPLNASPWSWFSAELRQIEREQAELKQKLSSVPELPSPQGHECAGFHSGFAPDADAVRWVQVDLGAERELDSVVIVPAVLGSSGAYGFPPRFRVDASNDPLFGEPVTLLDHTAKDARASMAPWHVPARGVRARHVRFTTTRLAAEPRRNGRFIFCLGELLVFSGGRNVALRAMVAAPRPVETPPTWLLRNVVDGISALGPPVVPEANPGNGWHSGIEKSEHLHKWVQVDLGEPRVVQEVRVTPAHPADYPDRFGFGFPKSFNVELSDTADFKRAHTLQDPVIHDSGSPGDHPVALLVPDVTARYVRMTAMRLWERSGDYVFALAEMQVISEGRNVALGAKVDASDDTFTAAWSRERLVDGKSSAGALMDEAEWLRLLSERRALEDALAALSSRKDAATATAQRRAGWFGAGLAGGAGLFLLAAWRRARQARHREMEALRHRISRDLHDEIGSHLGSIRLMSELALRHRDSLEAQETLEEIQRLSREAAESMRGMVWLLREGEAPTLDRLIEALRQSADELLKGPPKIFYSQCPVSPPLVSFEFYRQVLLFFREAVHNVARHANAKNVELAASMQPDGFMVCIKDDGVGFDPATATGGGNGLANLRHRASLIGGTLKIESAPGQGTRITLEAPLS